eukprot:gene2823-3116_t
MLGARSTAPSAGCAQLRGKFAVRNSTVGIRIAGSRACKCFAALDTRPPAVQEKQQKVVELSPLTKDYLTPKAVSELAPIITFEAASPRPATADVYYPAQGLGNGQQKVRAVVFGHGFSQPARNYRNIIGDLTQAGWLVIAPRTEMFDVLGRDIGITIDATKADIKLKSTLQAALIVDMLKSLQLLYNDEEFKGKVGDVCLVGHSLGGACSIIAAAKLQVGMLNGNPESVEAAMKFFKEEFPAETPLALISSINDHIATAADQRRLFVLATASRENEDVALFTIDGNHVGYEDELDLPTAINFVGAHASLGPIRIPLEGLQLPLTVLLKVVNSTLIKVAEVCQYRFYWLSPILGNSPKQQPQAQAALDQTLAAICETSKTKLKISDVLVNSKTFEDAGVAVEAQPGQAEVDKVLKQEPLDNTTPDPLINGLLASYALVHLYSSITGFQLLQSDASGDFETRLGLIFLSALAASLTFDNSLLVAGRFIGTRGETGLQLLQELSKWRFLAHSGAPLLLVAALNMAGRAGVEWAANPVYEGLVGLLILAVVTISSIRNSLFLEIAPRWSRGILRFAYNETSTDFTRLIPVVVTMIVTIVLGAQSYDKDSSLWPFLVGPVLAFILNAIPPSKDGNGLPQFVTGNGGEALLFLSLVMTEGLLRAHGQ